MQLTVLSVQYQFQNNENRGLQTGDNYIEHGSESHSTIGDVLVNNNDGEPNKESP